MTTRWKESKLPLRVRKEGAMEGWEERPKGSAPCQVANGKISSQFFLVGLLGRPLLLGEMTVFYAHIKVQLDCLIWEESHLSVFSK